MDQPGQEGPGREHHGIRVKDKPDLRHHPDHLVTVEHQIVDGLLEQG